jgi:hypothetical protein
LQKTLHNFLHVVILETSCKISYIKALSYKPEGHRFKSQWSHWIFQLLIPSSRTMVTGSTQPLTEMSTRNLSGSKESRPAHKFDNLTAIPEPVILKMWETQCPTIPWAFTDCYSDSFTFYAKLFIYFLTYCFRVTDSNLLTHFDYNYLISTFSNEESCEGWNLSLVLKKVNVSSIYKSDWLELKSTSHSKGP